VPRIGILASGDTWHAGALERALAAHGCEVARLDARRLTSRTHPRPSIDVGPAAPAGAGRFAAGAPTVPAAPLDDLDALVVRFIPGGSLDQVVYRIDSLHVLTDRGLPVINAPRTLERTVDKHWCSQLLVDAGVPTPRTIAAESFDDAMEAFRAMGDAVIKPLLGSGGRGIVRVSDEDLAYRTFRALEMQRAVFYVQEFVPHGRSDLRVFTAGDRAVAAAQRIGDGWKTNVAAGAQALPHRLLPEEEELALRASRAVGADYAGVDLLRAEDGRLLVVEVNGIPGWSALQKTTDIDLASEVARLVLASLAGRHATAPHA